MNCSNCDALINENDHFCENCGKHLFEVSVTPKVTSINCLPGQCKPDREGYCENCGMKCLPTQEEITIDGQLAMISSVGRKHTINEDAGAVCRGESSTILIVADGVSSSTNGKMASTTAIKVIGKSLKLCNNPDKATLAMHEAIEEAHKNILTLSSKDCEVGPETTIVVALCHGQQLVLGWVGDSRAYLITEDVEQQITIDDSWIEMVVKAGQYSREAATADKRSHYVTQTLGMKDDELDIHVIQTEIPQNSFLLLCSDGLWNYFPNSGDLAKAIYKESNKNTIEICNNLVKIANAKGGHDNITAALLSVTSNSITK